MMQFSLIDNQEDYRGLVGEIKPSQFLQSWQWGEFQKKLGREVQRIKISRENDLAAVGQAIIHDLPFGLRYIYLPRGPVISPLAANHDDEFVSIFEKELIKLDKKAIFVRTESIDFDFSRPGWRKTKEVQPEHTLILGLDMGEDNLLAAMHQKTRYNIRLAAKRGVSVRQMAEGEFDKFWNLISVTTERDKFRPHPKSYYRKMLESLGDMAQVWFAEYKGKVLAANLMIFYGDTAVYLHGASSNEYRNVMAPYLLHWEMIKKAKADGFEHYDFWGIAPPDQPNHPWAGITRFKKGFGGIEVSYPGTFDLPLNKFWYTLYRLRTGK
jgi:lipid II:glycine glycyltransferase (peptidoglycan interpeptide bridge formation enzyme)